MKKYEPFDLAGLNTYSVHERTSKVSIANFAKPLMPGASMSDFIASLPDQLLGHDFPELVQRVVKCRKEKRPVVIGMGAHVIKVGLNPVLIDLMERGLVTGLAVNGACLVHDTEIALVGQTSEEVDKVLGDGAFGAARETGEMINTAVREGAESGKGIGEAMGDYLLGQKLPFVKHSLIASARRLGVPVTVHVAMGTDIVHIHPSACGASIGKAGHHDFRVFCSMVADLEGGAYLNLGSAVLLPEVFLKALTAVRNLGARVQNFTTANFDFIRHYRPLTNVVNRPTSQHGKGYHLTGHHEIMIPLFAAALLDAYSVENESKNGSVIDEKTQRK